MGLTRLAVSYLDMNSCIEDGSDELANRRDMLRLPY